MTRRRRTKAVVSRLVLVLLVISRQEGLLLLLELSLNREGSVRHCAQTFLRDELARLTADTIGLIFDTKKSSLKVVDELQQTLCHTTSLPLGERSSAFVYRLEGRLCIGDIIALVVDGTLAKEVIITDSLVELLHNQLTKLLQFFVSVGGLLVTHYIRIVSV